jgi:DNA-binding NtrC family response regulator
MTIETLTLTHPSRFRGRSEDVAFSLVVTAGPGPRASFFLGGDAAPRVLIGQSPSCLVRLDDPAVSRRHAALDIGGTHLVVTDLASRNGVIVNGVAVEVARLHGHEVIQIGGTKLRVIVEGAESTPYADDHFGPVWGASVELRRVFAVAARLAASEVPVLVEGEAGTGKDLLAEAIHAASRRASGPFVVLDCADASASELAETLFGGGGSNLGLLEQADGGTLLIDEVARLDLPTQARLLRVLERGEIGRAGGSALPIDVRAIAATRKNLDRAVEDGTFRDDLLLRLAPGRVELPPLRRRDGDATLLVERFWSQLGGEPALVPYELASLEWPGNVRELESAVVRRLIHPESAIASIASADLVDTILAEDLPLPVARDRVVREFERRYVERVLAKTGGNVVQAAAASGVARRYFQLLRAKVTPRRR